MTNTKKKKIVFILTIIGVILLIAIAATGGAMHYTSSTRFCLSCHSMQIPYQEYQGSVHFSNSKGIRAECADCHISSDPIDYLLTKIRSTKDIYHEFVSKKIDSEEKYEQHRQAMAETVWAQLKQSDSATCRSCHDLEAMELFDQSKFAQQMHEQASITGETCIDCHKGVAHIPPTPSFDDENFNSLLVLAKQTPIDASTVYPIETISMGQLGTISTATPLMVLTTENSQRQVKIDGYQMKGADSFIYADIGKRSIIANITEQARQIMKFGEYQTDQYDNQWRKASLIADINSPVLDNLTPLWDYAEQLDNVYCGSCHAKIPANHFTVNAWGPIAKSMGERTNISQQDLDILTKFFQYHAKDAVAK